MSKKQVQTAPSMSAAEFGGYLRTLREQKSLSLGEVSERLKLPVRQIEALETGNYEELPEPVFVRGFVRSYASFLDADEEQLNNYLAHFSPPTSIRKVSHGKSSVSYSNTEVKKSFPLWILGLLGLLLIGGGIFAWQSKSQFETNKQNTVASEVLAVSDSNIAASNVEIKAMTASDVLSASSASSVAASSTDTQAASAVSASAPVLANGELVIKARYRTVLTVSNAKGEVLISKIVPARTEHRFTDGAPFDVRIGYSTGSTVTFNGEEIDLAPYRKGRTATFKVGDTTGTASAAK